MSTRLNRWLRAVRTGGLELNLRKYYRRLQNIDKFATELSRFPDQRIQSMARGLKERIVEGVASDDVLSQSFALVREAAVRVLSLRPHDEQLLAGIAMYQGKVAQMQTGEGKTLAAVAPAFVGGLTGHGVHILTFNDYLAKRDAQWMGELFHFLGLSVGYAQQQMSVDDRRSAYARDITYLTAQQAGFDFLRDQLCMQPSDLVHRNLHYAIIDEADSILIDEARVPLVIAGDASGDTGNLRAMAEAIRYVTSGEHYTIGERHRTVSFTSSGLDLLEQLLQCRDLHDEQYLPLLTRLNLALQAEVLLWRDRDYIVRDDQIFLLDEFTGRIAENRRWPYGLQAAVEAKENLTISKEGRILNSIALQHFIPLYRKLGGMSGTAEQAAEELNDFYGLKVVVIPTHRPGIRSDLKDVIYTSQSAKFDALLREITITHRTGRPVLVGTASVSESDQLANKLRNAGLGCRVLNATNDHEESEIVAEAGAYGAITISTNMAGRGTDIKLGGQDERDRSRVVSLGGLYVLGCNRHESRRIDNQLRGRAGRQGDPGGSQFIVSLEDDLLTRFNMQGMLTHSIDPLSPDRIADAEVGRRIEHIQRVIEGECYEIRRTLYKYSSVMEQQRAAIHQWRQRILFGSQEHSIFERRSPEKYKLVKARFGNESMATVEKRITLFQISQCWSDHLAHIAELRDSIHLFSLGGFNPLDKFQRLANQAYRHLLAQIDDQVVATFESLETAKDEFDLAQHCIISPSATWTYMINDHPMGDVLDGIRRGVRRTMNMSD